jgi:hypothetical protein
MSHRIDIELTSQNGEAWTWRAAGARQPKGALDSTLLYPGAVVGDVVRAEAERELDGVRILSVIAPRTARAEAERVEMVAREHAGGVSVQYAERPGGRRDGGPRGDRPGGDRPDRGPRREGGARPERGPRSDDARGERPARSSRPDRPAREARPDRGADRPADRAPAKGQKRLNPGRVHRDALLAELAPEKRPVAEQLFRGGIPAVRQAIIDQNAQLKAAGQPEVPAASLLTMADELLPRVRTADWLDRAAAALTMADELTIRDLRAVVTQADQGARDDASREMGQKLREALTGRIESERTTWANDIGSAIDEGKLVRGLRLAGRVPDPAAKLDPEVTARLVSATNEALSPQTRPDVWAAMIEAAADAPFRRDIVPAGLPENPGESLLTTAANASNRIPALLKLLGLTMPPPPRAKGAVLPPKRPPAPPTRPVRAASVTAAGMASRIAEAPTVATEPVEVPSEAVVDVATSALEPAPAPTPVAEVAQVVVDDVVAELTESAAVADASVTESPDAID